MTTIHSHIAEIERALEGATPGEWELTEATAPGCYHFVLGGEGQAFGLLADVTNETDAAYIASVSPARIKAILEYLKQVEGERDRLRKAVSDVQNWPASDKRGGVWKTVFDIRAFCTATLAKMEAGE